MIEVTGLSAALRQLLGAGQMLSKEEIEPRYKSDETHGASAEPAFLVRPASTEQVSAVLGVCNRFRQAVVPQGGRTGMARAALPQEGELILSLERMRAVEEIDEQAFTMTVQAGTPLAAVQEAAAKAGLFFPVDIGARGSCTIGGMIATNAGGNQVLRYGMMRDNVLGVEVVLADGTVLPMLNKMLKNNAGFDLKQLFIGSEGTLGIITRAVLRLRPEAPRRAGALCALESYESVVSLLRRIERLLPARLTAYEVMWQGYYRAACRAVGGSPPCPDRHPLFVLLEIVEADARDSVAEILAAAIEEGIISDAVVTQSDAELGKLWQIRDAIGRLVAGMKLVEPFDVSIPIGNIGRFVECLSERLTADIPGCQALFFGHIADSNLHLALELPVESARQLAEERVYSAVREFSGSISAEHGIGMLKRSYLGYTRSAPEIALMRQLRGVLDPNGILSPGRVVASEDRN